MDEVPLLDMTLPIELTNGNDGRGSRWFKSAAVRTKLEQQLQHLRRQPFNGPVRVVITRVLGPRQSLWDADSVLRGSAKELIDALVALGWFHDDGPKFITACDGRQVAPADRSDGPAVRIEVYDDRPF